MNDMIDELTFKEKIKTLSDREISEFTALQLYDMCKLCSDHTIKIQRLEDRDHKQFGVAGGIGGAIVAIVGAVIVTVLRQLGVDV